MQGVEAQKLMMMSMMGGRFHDIVIGCNHNAPPITRNGPSTSVLLCSTRNVDLASLSLL